MSTTRLRLQTVVYLHQQPTVECIGQFLTVAECKSLFQTSSRFSSFFSSGEFLARICCYDPYLACKHGALSALKWLTTNMGLGTRDFPIRQEQFIVPTLARRQVLPLIFTVEQWHQWFFEYAASCGHLDIVQWLHANRSDCFTDWATSNAAKAGHLHIIRFLHSKHTDYCCHLTMENAASSGHLDIVQWLHQNAGVCSKYALSVATGEVAEWLISNCLNCCKYSDSFD